MMLYILTPDYSITKDMFEPKEIPSLDKNGASKMLSAYHDMLKAKKV